MMGVTSSQESIADVWEQNLGAGAFRVSTSCNGVDYPPDSREFFDWSEYQRYVIAFPWLRSAAGIKTSAGQDVLEIGFGLGIDLLSFARRGAKVWGVELSPKLIELTIRRFQAAGYSCRLVVGDARELPFPQASFDLVYSFDVFSYFADIETAVKEVDRVLRPGGRAIIGFFHRGSWRYRKSVMASWVLDRAGLRSVTPAELFSTSLGLPLPARALSRREARRLFAQFRQINVRVYRSSFTSDEQTLVGRPLSVAELLSSSLPDWVKQRLKQSRLVRRLIALGFTLLQSAFGVVASTLGRVAGWLAPFALVPALILTPAFGQILVIQVTK